MGKILPDEYATDIFRNNVGISPCAYPCLSIDKGDNGQSQGIAPTK